MALKVRGYAAVFGNKDRDGEIVVKGAFSNWIAENPTTPVKLYWMHSHKFNPLAKPIGVTTKIKQDAKGLYVEAEILDTPEGLEVQELMKHGALREASFGYNTKDRYQKNNVWHLSDLDLMEVTIANWGANNKAYFEAIPEPEGETDGNEE